MTNSEGFLFFFVVIPLGIWAIVTSTQDIKEWWNNRKEKHHSEAER